MSTETYSRKKPYLSRLIARERLTGPGSTKKTYHISLDINGSHLNFKPGDSVGLLPENDPRLVDEILFYLGYSTDLSLRNHLLQGANLNKLPPSLLKEAPSDYGLIDLVQHRRLEKEELTQLLPLLPRFYSIASSRRVFPSELHLTVSVVEFEHRGRLRHGVGSRFLETAPLGRAIPIYVQHSLHFALPEDPSRSILLIGPGTGVAPFRAFLQERLALNAPGRNWLFFGERHSKTDFYYREFFIELEKQGRLRLDTAFSRDGDQKLYVQHRLLEEKKSVFNWLEEGAYIYICGDAKRMAPDVETALKQILSEEGKITLDEAGQTLKNWRKQRRLLLDVY